MCPIIITFHSDGCDIFPLEEKWIEFSDGQDSIRYTVDESDMIIGDDGGTLPAGITYDGSGSINGFTWDGTTLGIVLTTYFEYENCGSDTEIININGADGCCSELCHEYDPDTRELTLLSDGFPVCRTTINIPIFQIVQTELDLPACPGADENTFYIVLDNLGTGNSETFVCTGSGWQSVDSPINPELCCTYYSDQTSLPCPTSPAAPTVIPPVIQVGDTIIEAFDNCTLYWTYTGTWDLGMTSSHCSRRERTFCEFFANLTGGSNLFSVDTGIAGLQPQDVVSVSFIYNGAEQPDTSQPGMSIHTVPTGTEYNGFSINGTAIEIQTTEFPGLPEDPCWARLCVVVWENC